MPENRRSLEVRRFSTDGAAEFAPPATLPTGHQPGPLDRRPGHGRVIERRSVAGATHILSAGTGAGVGTRTCSAMPSAAHDRRRRRRRRRAERAPSRDVIEPGTAARRKTTRQRCRTENPPWRRAVLRGRVIRAIGLIERTRAGSAPRNAAAVKWPAGKPQAVRCGCPRCRFATRRGPPWRRGDDGSLRGRPPRPARRLIPVVGLGP